MNRQGHWIAGVKRRSAAHRAGLMAGDRLIAMNGEPVRDEIDYQFFSAMEKVVLVVARGGEEIEFTIAKADWEPLGLSFAAPLTGATRVCSNNCAFCFVDQMPKGMRDSLYVKDDDWRLSLRDGHYITLTNVGDAEFARILARRASPLYISVHATDPDARARLLGNPKAGNILGRLRALRDAGLHFHAQIVACIGYNDGPVLERTLEDLLALYPAACSVAVVPVGLTKFREGLSYIEPYAPDTARATIRQVERFQKRCLEAIGTRFAFCADELYTLAGVPLPQHAEYEDYPQIENGVGMLRTLEEEYLYAMQQDYPAGSGSALIVCGTSAAGFLREMLQRHPPSSRQSIEVLAVVNRFFGQTVTVSGLLTGGDLRDALRGKRADKVLLTSNAMRSGEDVFLDGMTLDELRAATGLCIDAVANDGEALLWALGGSGGNE